MYKIREQIMKMIKKTSLFSTLLLLTATLNNHTMEQPLPKKTTIEPYITWVGKVLLGETKPITMDEISSLAQFSPEMQNKTTDLLLVCKTAGNLQLYGKTINELSNTHKTLYELINDPLFYVKLTTYLTHRFNCTDVEVARALSQQLAAAKYVSIMQQFIDCIETEEFNAQEFNNLYAQYKQYINLNFTYLVEGAKFSLLLSACNYDQDAHNNIRTHCLLKTNTINVNAQFYEGITTLMYAVATDNVPVVELLCKYPGTNINLQDQDGRTALIRAIMAKSVHTVQLLLDAGAHPEIGNWDGFTPLELAHYFGTPEIFELIYNEIRERHGTAGAA
jgi:hypothetical protein